MHIMILPGLDGTGLFQSEVTTQLAPAHTATTLRYPVNLSCYDDLQNWIETMLPGDSYILVAESFSGPLAIRIAARKPRHLKGIIFAATFAKSPRTVPRILMNLAAVLPIKSKLFIRLVQPIVMGRWATHNFTRTLYEGLKTVPASTLIARLQEVLRVHEVTKIPTIEVPYIYLQATKDRLIPARMANDFQLTSDKITKIEGPHFLFQAKPQAYAQHIVQFAAKVAD